jgi:gamma-glutamyltranspeptidase / glutathione hydrolase
MRLLTVRRRAALVGSVGWALAACRPAAAPPAATPAHAAPAAALPPRLPAAFPAGWQFPAGRGAAFAEHAMIASNSRLASEAGVEILRRGGNAVDAAVAVGFALAVTHPEAGNLGGGGYMVIRMADGRVAALDFRETAPLGATRNMYLDARGQRTDRSVTGHLASGVPGSVAGLTSALAKYGTLPLSTVMTPAIRTAESGFVVDGDFHRSIANQQGRIARFGGRQRFLPDGEPPPVGSTFRQPELAGTLRRIARWGADGFYRGTTAELIAAEMRRGGGIIIAEDLARYHPIWREPLRYTYRGDTLISMPPSSSGGVTMAETLHILEGYDPLPPFGSAAYLHLLASALQRAFVDRNAKLGDPSFVRVPVDELTSATYAARLRTTIGAGHVPTRALMQTMAAPVGEGTHTTHYSVVDAAGNAVATTTTLNDLYGSGVWVEGAGFFLNDEMDDFTTAPGVPNLFGLVQGEANAISPGKRMLSAMSPTIVLDRAGRLLLIVGSRGGPRIISSTAEVILNVLDHGMDLADAVSAPRVHHQALPDVVRFEPGGLSASAGDSLQAMGYELEPFDDAIGRVMAVMRAPGGWQGVVDPRSYGGAVGY